MRRWMIVLAIAGLFVALLAAPGAGKQKPVQDIPEYVGAGTTTFGAIAARTGEVPGGKVRFCRDAPWGCSGGELANMDNVGQLLDPDMNWCRVESAILELGERNSAVLTTTEYCPGPPQPELIRTKVWDVHITPGGTVKMMITSRDPGPPEPPSADPGEHWLAEFSGCALSNTFPVYHGRFNFDSGDFYAATHFHGICDGGIKWGNLPVNITSETGPLHITSAIDLTFETG